MPKHIKSFFIIFLLGISSGIPLSLITSTFRIMLVEKDFDLSTIGFLSLLTVPYSLKIFFAPLIDSLPIPFLTKKFGNRKSWIIFTQASLVIFISTLGYAGDNSSLLTITIFGFLLGLASASQDVVIDGYRIELIKKENQGIASGFYVYGYRVGMLLSGVLGLFLAEYFSWMLVYFLMSIFMIICLVITAFNAEEARTNWQFQKYDLLSWIKKFVVEPFTDFSNQKNWILILFFISSFKLADAFAGPLIAPFLRNIGFSKIEIATVLKTFGLFATLLGVFFGGMIVKKIGLINSLWIAVISQGISNLAFAYQAKMGNNITVLYFVVFIENFSGGVGDAVFVAYLSSLCNINFTVTQYSLLSSFSTISRSFVSSGAGIYAENLGWNGFFILSTFLSIPAIISLLWITRKNLVKILKI